MQTSYSMKSKLFALFCFSASVLPVKLAAQEITLTSQDGSIRLSGQLISVSDDHYVVRGPFGDVNIPTDKTTCEGSACPMIDTAMKTLNIAGSDTIGEELMPLLISGLAETDGAAAGKASLNDFTTSVVVLANQGKGDELFSANVQFKGSSTGFAALLDGTADIGMSSRPVKPEEAKAFTRNGLGNLADLAQEHAFALDGLLVIVHPDQPVSALTMEQISGLLSGRIANWKDVGGPDLAVKVYSRGTESGTFATISDKILKTFGEELSPNAIIDDKSEQLSAAVSNDLGAIGYVGFAFKGDSKPLKLISSCNITYDPTSFAAKVGEYPLSRKLYLYTTNRPQKEPAKNLVAFSTSSQAYPFIEKAGFLSYLPEVHAQSETAEAVRAAIDASTSRAEVNGLRELFIDLGEWDRLTTTFRFQTGSAMLDNTSQRDLIRLVDYLNQSPKGTQVAFVGFTDSDGPYEANRFLGQGRAESIAELVSKGMTNKGIDPSTFVVKSYGELSPVACNDEIAGQMNNRRVEVWIHR